MVRQFSSVRFPLHVMTVKPIQSIYLLLFIALVGIAVYAVGLKIPYYADDFQFLFDRSAPAPAYRYFYEPVPENPHYRPLQAAFLSLVQSRTGTNTVPVHAVQIAAHILLSWLIGLSLLTLGFGFAQAMLAAMFMLISQANVHAVLSNDTFSQLGAALFGVLALLLLYSARGGGLFVNPKYYLSIIALALTYLSKESGISYIIMIVIVSAIISYDPSKGVLPSFKRFLVTILPYLLVTFLYLALRSQIVQSQPSFGGDGAYFRVGANVIVNLAMLLFAAVTPISSVATFLAVENGAQASVLAHAGLSLFFVMAVAAGLWLSRKSRPIWLILAVFSIIGLFPMILMGHVSELYVYNSMPFVAALVGVGLGSLLEISRRRRIANVLAILLIASLFVTHIAAVQAKAQMMQESGQHAERLIDHMQAYVDDIPSGGTLLLVNSPDRGPEYSVFLLKGFNPLKNGLHRINEVSGRSDFSIQIVEIANIHEQVKQYADSVALIVGDDQTVRMYSADTPNQ